MISRRLRYFTNERQGSPVLAVRNIRLTFLNARPHSATIAMASALNYDLDIPQMAIGRDLLFKGQLHEDLHSRSLSIS